MSEKENTERVRLDRWLWAARFYKTRSAATRAVSGGKVRLNGRRPKPSSPVMVGDELQLQKGIYEFRLEVRALAEKRGAAGEAGDLYEETPDSRRARETRRLQMRTIPRADFRDGGRPTKKQRRDLERLRGYRKK